MATKAKHTNVGSIAARLHRAYASTNEQQRADGSRWYGEARAWIDGLHQCFPQYSREQIAAVVAVTSPSTDWNRNLVLAQHYVTMHAADYPRSMWTERHQYGACMAKAERVLDGDLTAVSGPKVTAFFANLCGDEEAVTVDTWMVRAALPGVPLTDARSAAIVRACRAAARRYDLTPAQGQAVLWVWIRDNAATRAA